MTADKRRGDQAPLRAQVLAEATRLITMERNNQYGPPTQDFVRWAGAATAMGYRGPDGRELAGHDLALLMSLLKISRLMWTPEKQDSWIDLAGYAACGYEVAMERHGSGESIATD